MKGPYERLKYDLRRLWECPASNRRERTAGSVSYRFCQCQMKQADGKPVVMKLVEDGVQRLTRPVTIQHEPAIAPAPVEPPPAGDDAHSAETAAESAGADSPADR